MTTTEAEDIYTPEGLDLTDEESRKSWKIDGAETASWALRKLAGIRKRQADVDHLYEAERFRLDRWRDDQTERHANDARYFEAVLRNYHEERLQADPKLKTISLPFGKLVARKTNGTTTVNDEEFIEWALPLDENLVSTIYKPRIKEIKQYIKDTGEVPPGVTLGEESISYKAETENDEL